MYSKELSQQRRLASEEGNPTLTFQQFFENAASKIYIVNSYGARMCLGHRLADLEMQILFWQKAKGDPKNRKLKTISRNRRLKEYFLTEFTAGCNTKPGLGRCFISSEYSGGICIETNSQKAITSITKLMQSKNFHLVRLRQSHINVWSDLWATGFTINTSKAESTLNGDRINATMYAVLSQTPSETSDSSDS
uniref:Uncharacterized protein n=1 Tax=Glossina austeni TaxID=7395 RepID=A0A1A9UIQ5_GLOAU